VDNDVSGLFDSYLDNIFTPDATLSDASGRVGPHTALPVYDQNYAGSGEDTPVFQAGAANLGGETPVVLPNTLLLSDGSSTVSSLVHANTIPGVNDAGDEIGGFTCGAFGDNATFTGSTKNPYFYKRYHYDKETDEYHCWNRYYNPDTGASHQVDPVISAPPGCWFPTAPISFLDSTGLYNDPVHFDIVAMLAAAAGWDSRFCKYGVDYEVIAKQDLAADYGGRHPGWISLGFNRKLHFPYARDLKAFWKKALTCKPKEIGEYFHALQDSFSHQRGATHRSKLNEWRFIRVLWHAFRLRSPDHTWRRPELAMRMARATYDRLVTLQQICCKCPGTVTVPWEDIAGDVASEIFMVEGKVINNPDWQEMTETISIVLERAEGGHYSDYTDYTGN
jgi:RHS repeat-associated protein